MLGPFPATLPTGEEIGGAEAAVDVADIVIGNARLESQREYWSEGLKGVAGREWVNAFGRGPRRY
jgi:hypothetical protein